MHPRCEPLASVAPVENLSAGTLQKREGPAMGGAFGCDSGAGNETRTRDPDLGKVVLYQLSYSRT